MGKFRFRLEWDDHAMTRPCTAYPAHSRCLLWPAYGVLRCCAAASRPRSRPPTAHDSTRLRRNPRHAGPAAQCQDALLDGRHPRHPGQGQGVRVRPETVRQPVPANSRPAYNSLAELEMRQGRVHEAVAMLSKALETPPEGPGAAEQPRHVLPDSQGVRQGAGPIHSRRGA